MKCMSDFIIYLYTMDELIELVYYYNFEVKTFEVWIWLPNSDTDYYWWTIDKEKEIRKYKLRIISKEYWFIKWLVENDKIKPLRKFIGWETDEDEPYIQFDLVDQYIAYLSIQDEPIKFLISILK